LDADSPAQGVKIARRNTFTVDVGRYGLLGLVVAWLLWSRGSILGYFIGVAINGVVDIAFTFALLFSRVIEPTVPTVAGPIIWVIAVFVTPFGLQDWHQNDLS
jgi:hypothetical protein